MKINADTIAKAAQAAQTAVELIPMGAAGIKAAKAVLSLVNDLREAATATPDKVAEFEASREALERAVNAHADRTADNLGDA